jgi:peptide chain release factor 2
MKVLKARVYELYRRKQEEAQLAQYGEKKKIEWGSQIRSYVLDDRRVKDHRTGYQTSQTDLVLNGDLTPFLKAYLMNETVGAESDED